MLRRSVLIILTSVCVLITFSNKSFSQSGVDSTGKFVDIDVSGGWIDTGIHTQIGDVYIIRMRGAYEVGGDTWPPSKMRDAHKPEGDGAGGGAIADISMYAVIAKIGGGAPFYIGSMSAFTADTSGELYIGINDTSPGDNSGPLTAEIYKTFVYPEE